MDSPIAGSSFLPHEVQPIQLARLFSIFSGAFSWTSRSGRGLLPAKVVAFSDPAMLAWPLLARGGLEVVPSAEAESPLTLLVSLRMPGKLPALGAPWEDGTRGVDTPEKKDAELRGLLGGGDRGA